MLVAPDGISSLGIILTGRCNLGCSYCYRGGSGDRDLAEDALTRALTMVLRNGTPDLEVIFSGGEPTLRFDVFRRAVERLRAGVHENRHLALRLVSNGTLLTDDRLRFLEEHEVNLSLSLDGVPTAQRLRDPDSVAGLDRMLKRLRRLQPDYLAHRVSAVMTLLPSTVSCLPDSVEHLLAAGIREIRLSAAMSPVPGWDDDLRAELEGRLTSVRRRCEQHLAETGEVPLLPLRRFGPEPSPGRGNGDGAGLAGLDRGHCAIASGAAPALDTDGCLYACLMFAPSGIGTGRKQQLLRQVARTVRLGRPGDPGYPRYARRLPAALAAERGFAPQARLSSRFGACSDCPARLSCMICPYTLLRFAGNDDCTRVPAFVCAFHREMARQRAWMPAQAPVGSERWQAEAIEARRLRFIEQFGLTLGTDDGAWRNGRA